jgi:hypothetical protein
MQNQMIWNTMLDRVRKNKFLPVDCNISKQFAGSDTEELFNANLKTQSANWEYRTKPVNYTYNKDFYRTGEFKNLDWAKSIVIFGCSNVFGVGQDEHDTVSSTLERLAGIPVINMGVGGSSINFSLHNSIIMNQSYPTPHAVVHLWTEESRCVYYAKKKLFNLGSWKHGHGNYFDAWTTEMYNYKTNALFASLISQQLWEGKCKYYEASYFGGTANTLKCDRINDIDKARDLMHFGPKTTLYTAEKIANKLNL